MPIAFGSRPTSTLHQHQDDSSTRFFQMHHQQPAPAPHPATFHQAAPAPHPASFHQAAPAPHPASFHQPAPHPASFHQPQPVHHQAASFHDPNYRAPAKAPPSIGGKGIVPKVK